MKMCRGREEMNAQALHVGYILFAIYLCNVSCCSLPSFSLKLKDCLGLHFFFIFTDLQACLSTFIVSHDTLLHSHPFLCDCQFLTKPFIYLYQYFFSIQNTLISLHAIITSTFNFAFNPQHQTNYQGLWGFLSIFVFSCGEFCLFQQQLAFSVLLPSAFSPGLPPRCYSIALQLFCVFGEYLACHCHCTT